MSSQASKQGTAIQALAVIFSLALFLAPLTHILHLIAEPHVFCHIHGHFESTEEHHEHDSGHHEHDSAPPEKGDHEDEDSTCFLAAISSRGEEPGLVSVLSVQVSVSGVVVAGVSSTIFVRDVIMVAPKTSPPLPSPYS